MSRAAQGLRAWLAQRFTAVYLGLYVLISLAAWLPGASADYAAWVGWFGQPLVAIATALAAMALLVHAWIGVRDVLIDYVHALWLRLALMALTALVLGGSLLWLLRALALATLSTSPGGAQTP